MFPCVPWELPARLKRSAFFFRSEPGSAPTLPRRHQPQLCTMRFHRNCIAIRPIASAQRWQLKLVEQHVFRCFAFAALRVVVLFQPASLTVTKPCTAILAMGEKRWGLKSTLRPSLYSAK